MLVRQDPLFFVILPAAGAAGGHIRRRRRFFTFLVLCFWTSFVKFNS